MKTAIFKTLCLFFGFIVLTNIAQAQITISFSSSNYNGYNISCNRGIDGSVTANPSGGTAPYTYVWSTGATTQTISDIPASYYAVTVTDYLGTTATNGLNLTEPQLIDVQLTSPEYGNGYNISCWNCFNGSISTAVTGGVTSYSYSWADGPTIQNRSSVAGGIYRITVTDANNCTADKEITLTEPSRDDWTMTGNTGSNPNIHYIGTADNTDLLFKTNGSEKLRIKNNGYIGIGTNNPTQVLDVNGGAKIGGAFTANSIQIANLSIGNPCAALVHLDATGNITVFDQNACSLSVLPFWSTIGNTLPDNTTQFIGTISNHDFRIKTNNIERMIIKADGKVGIGTSDPQQYFEISHNDASGSSGMILRNTDNSSNYNSEIKFFRGPVATQIAMWAIGCDVSHNGGKNFFIYDNEAASGIKFYIDDAGRTGIGLVPPTTSSLYKLFVEGGIATRDVKVTAGNFPDYVLEEKYSLRSLAEVEQFIKTNKHLPEIPSAKEVEANEGFEVGDMQTRLLKKVEELTLYIIEHQKQMDEIKKELAAVKNK